MLIVKDLCKTYKPKRGVAVTALDHISLTFPEKGMVFLLGKSGSGKSTLLNILGGLDRADSGEIIIKGVSAKNFSQQHFDSYRNTYVGFIFQEYNVMEEFSVGANIALALQLQGKKATDEEINRILCEVDLEGYGSRKPNELSGGQKQRVAIARALVKNPRIIMADEPTGALDSATGQQVLQTLKKLSEDKLVLVVSHDRDFAEKYADRIIELADGRVISDMEAAGESLPAQPTPEYTEQGILIPGGYRLTEQDLEQINAYLAQAEQTTQITAAPRRSTQSARRFRPTDTGAIRYTDKSPFTLIKSKLPMKNAFRIGAGGLKHKKLRLIFTILLSCIAFTMFGLADTFGSYDHIRSCTDSLIDSDMTYASVKKGVKLDPKDEYWYTGYNLSEKDIQSLCDKTGLPFTGVYQPVGADLSFSTNYDTAKIAESKWCSVFSSAFSGFAEIDQTALDNMKYPLLAGRLPDGSKDEIAISAYLYKVFDTAGYRADDQSDFQPIASYDDLIGKTLTFAGGNYEVVGIVDTGFDWDRYQMMTKDQDEMSNAEALIYYMLMQELGAETSYSFSSAAMVGEGFVERMLAVRPRLLPTSQASRDLWFYSDSGESFGCSYVTSLDRVDPDNITWLGEKKSVLGEKEVILSASSFGSESMGNQIEDSLAQVPFYMNLYHYAGEEEPITEDNWHVVGYFSADSDLKETVVVPESLYNTFSSVVNVDDIYNYAVSPMPQTEREVFDLVSDCYTEEGDTAYPLQSAVTYELDSFHEGLKIFSKVLWYIGIFFAFFAALLLANFIGTSIAYKKQEIGILRAIGSRSADVFRIFFSESFLIAMINFVLSMIGTGVCTAVFNHITREQLGVLITLLHFGLRQIGLLFAVSIAVAFVASFIPVKKIASKRPIDAIRNR